VSSSNNGGNGMTDQHDDVIEPFDFNRHRLQAIEKYRKVRSLYEEYASVIRNILSEAFDAQSIKIHSVEARAKTIDSFGDKSATLALEDPNKPYYPNPLSDITDLTGIRVIVFFPRTLDLVDNIIKAQFEVLEKSDKTLSLVREEKFGYGSIHYLIRLKENRTCLLEYNRFKDLVAEIQIRTILQHGWAEIEHDIQYKAVETIPTTIRRRFMSLAGLLEIADREFQAIQDEDDRLRVEARKSVEEGALEQVEITPDALKAYLDKKLGVDGRMSDWSYQWTAQTLRRLGFVDFKEIEECVSGYDDDELSRIRWGTRQGQLTRFEILLLAGLGEYYIKFHQWKDQEWFVNSIQKGLEKLRAKGIAIGSYLPTNKRLAEPDGSPINPAPADLIVGHAKQNDDLSAL
jgi:putative GTP pyrophosphokinase